MSSAGLWTWQGPCCLAEFPTYLRTSRSETETSWAAWETSGSTANPSTWPASSPTTAPRKVRRAVLRATKVSVFKATTRKRLQILITCWCVRCPGCPAKKNFCTKVACQNGGLCVSKWNTYSCECPTGYGGKNCEQGKKCVRDIKELSLKCIHFYRMRMCLYVHAPVRTHVFVCVCILRISRK